MCDADTLAELRAEDRVVVRYAENPNGSLDDIAGICNAGPQRRRADAAPRAGLRPDPRLRRRRACCCVRCSRRPVPRPRLDARPATPSATPTLARERLAVAGGGVRADDDRAARATCRRRSSATCSTSGCGPGHTTALLRAAFPLAEITGFDASAAMIDEARGRVPGAWFAVADVTRPLRLPADIVYARLPARPPADPDAALASWATVAAPGNGLLVCEEPVRYRSDDPLVRALRGDGHRGRGRDAARRSGPRPRARPRSARALRTACSTACVEHPVPAARAAAMFWRNAAQWRDRTRRRSTRCSSTSARSRQSGSRRAGDVADASGRVSSEAAVGGDAGLLQHLGRHAELAPRAVGDPLAAE